MSVKIKNSFFEAVFLWASAIEVGRRIWGIGKFDAMSNSEKAINIKPIRQIAIFILARYQLSLSERVSCPLP